MTLSKIPVFLYIFLTAQLLRIIALKISNILLKKGSRDFSVNIGFENSVWIMNAVTWQISVPVPLLTCPFTHFIDYAKEK